MGIFGHMLAGAAYGGATARVKNLEEQEARAEKRGLLEEQQNFQRQMQGERLQAQEGLTKETWKHQEKLKDEEREYKEGLLVYDKTFTDADGTVYAYSSKDPNSRVELGGKPATYDKILKLGENTVVGIKADGTVKELKSIPGAGGGGGASGGKEGVSASEKRLTLKAVDDMLKPYDSDWKKVPDIQKDIAMSLLDNVGLEVTKEEIEKKTWFGFKTETETKYGIGKGNADTQPQAPNEPGAEEPPKRTRETSALQTKTEDVFDRYAEVFGPEKAREKLEAFGSIAHQGPKAVNDFLAGMQQEISGGDKKATPKKEAPPLLGEEQGPSQPQGLLEEEPPAKEPGRGGPTDSISTEGLSPEEREAEKIRAQETREKVGDVVLGNIRKGPERVNRMTSNVNIGNPVTSAQESARNVGKHVSALSQALREGLDRTQARRDLVLAKARQINPGAAKALDRGLLERLGRDYFDPNTLLIKAEALPVLAEVAKGAGFTEEQIRQILGVK